MIKRIFVLSVPTLEFKQINEACMDCWSIKANQMDEGRLEQSLKKILGDLDLSEALASDSTLRLHLDPTLTTPVLRHRVRPVA